MIQDRLLDVSLLQEEKLEHIYFRALLPGKDICLGSFNPLHKMIHEIAKGMANQIYLLGDHLTKQCLVVDPCWDIDGIMKVIQKDDMHLVGAIITHAHFDHVGGVPPPPFDNYKITVPGVTTLLSRLTYDIPVYVGPGDYDTLVNECGVPKERLVKTTDDQELNVGGKSVSFLHAPGHTPGSQSILFNKNRLITGDTLFIGSCGRTDLKGGDTRQLYDTLQNRFRDLSNDTTVFPGHSYHGFKTTIGKERITGLLKPMSYSEFLERLGLE